MSNKTFLISISSLIFVFFLLTFLVMGGYTQGFDVAFCEAVYSMRTQFWNTVMIALSWVASTKGVTIIALALVMLLVIKKHYNLAVFVAVVNGVSPLINSVLKEIFERPRPGISAMEASSTFSYPSGHSQAAFVLFASIVVVVSFLAPKYLQKTIWISVTFVLLIGFSRIYLGMHYPTDVLAAYLVGSAWFITAMQLFKKFNFLELPEVRV